MRQFQRILIGLMMLFVHAGNAQTKSNSIPVIEHAACPVPVDSNFKTECGYLVVPENRNKHNGKTVKLPFVIARSNNPDKKKDPVLFTSGGPGASSLNWITNIGRTAQIQNRDCIAFEQRGTRYALPRLESNELSDAIRESYRKNLNKDSMVMEGVKRYKKTLEAKGIDLSGYNTDESAADIDDFLIAMHIDSVNLIGVSYSGGLMMAVLHKDPSRVRSLILDSPLPTFIPIDQDEPANLNEGLNVLFQHCAKDSAGPVYENLKEKFQQYFLSITHRSFYMPYVEKGTTDTLQIAYTKNDLLNAIENSLFDRSKIKEVPYIITEMIKGHHQPYMKEILDDIFNGNAGPSGMRLSVYCADQTVYHDESILQQTSKVYPYMEGYHINDVYKAICDCWQVPPVKPLTKQPFYSDKPALLADGEMDPACRPVYIDMIHHYMPNSQRLLFLNKSHGVFGRESNDVIKMFLDNPYKKIEPYNKNVIVY